MSFELYDDETIESLMVRVSLAKKLPYRYAAESLGLPSKLELLNLYHTNNTKERVYKIELLRKRLNIPISAVNLVCKSSKVWGSDFSSYKFGVYNIPAVLFRIHRVPICPICISDSSYIRIKWHFQTIRVCPEHNIRLIFKCPNCHKPLSYIKSETIDRCLCGANLSNIYLHPLDIDKGMRFCNETDCGVLLFFKIFNDIDVSSELSECQELEFDQFNNNLFGSIYVRLMHHFSNRQRILVKSIGEYSFNELWGNIVLKSNNLPDLSNQNNAVLKSLRKVLKKIAKDLNIPAFLSINESAILLGSDSTFVKSTISKGILTPRVKSLKNYIPLIDLRELSQLL